MENIGEKIMRARKKKGMTQDTLAQLVNVSRQTVSHWENGRAMPDVATAAQLSKVLDVNFLADEAAEDAAVQSPEAVPTIETNLIASFPIFPTAIFIILSFMSRIPL